MPQAEIDNPALLTIRNTRGLAIEIAAKCGLTRSAVWMWNREVPPKHAVIVARALKMPVHMVCPSIFPPPRKERNKKSSTNN